MTTWEYLTTPLLIHNTAAILNNWGKQGWELVQVVHGPRGRPRRLPEASGRRSVPPAPPMRGWMPRPRPPAVRGGADDDRLAPPRRARHRSALRGSAGGGLHSRQGARRPRLHLRAAADGLGRPPGDRQGRRRPRTRSGGRCEGVRPPVRAQRDRGRGRGRRRRRPAHRRREAHRLRRLRPRVHRSARRHQRRQRGARRDLRRERPARPLGGRRAGAAAGQPRRGRGRLLVA